MKTLLFLPGLFSRSLSFLPTSYNERRQHAGVMWLAKTEPKVPTPSWRANSLLVLCTTVSCPSPGCKRWVNVVGHHFSPSGISAGRAEVLKEEMGVNWHSTMERFEWQAGVSLTRDVLNVSQLQWLELLLIYSGKTNKILAWTAMTKNPKICKTTLFFFSSFFEI